MAPVIEVFERVNEISAIGKRSDFSLRFLCVLSAVNGSLVLSQRQKKRREEIQINYMDNDGNRYRNNIHDAADSRR